MNAILIALVIALAVTCAVLARLIWSLSRRMASERAALAELRGKLRLGEVELLRLQTVRRDFVANISHELRTPLASIKLLVETLEAGALEDRDIALSFTRKIGEETDHLITMAAELLELARLEAAPSMRPDRIDPAEVVQGSVERMRELARKRHVALRMELPPDLPNVWADAEQVGRALVNLLNNAIAFTPEGGSVTVSARAEPPVVAFSVSDTGPGIPNGEEQRIFERFYKVDPARQRPGAGLGLSIVRHIVEAQGGRIWARNRDSAGACFTFTLPLLGESSAVQLAGR